MLQATAVVFHDPNLRHDVMMQHVPPIDPNDTGRPTTADMLGLAILDSPSRGIYDLTGLDTATNLTTLYLYNNNLGDISLLAGLTKMQNLYLWGNSSISFLSSLSNMSDLRNLKAQNCNIVDINVVSNFHKLIGLTLSSNNISNLTPLSGAKALKYLYLSSNNISNISSIAGDVNLIELDLSDNFISDVTALSGLTKLTNLKLRANNIIHINPLSSLINLKYLYLSTDNDISDINALSGMTKLVELGLTDVNVGTITPLADVNQIQFLWLGTNRIKDVNSLTKFKNLKILALTYNPMSFDSWTDYIKQILINNHSNLVPPTSTKYLSSSPLIANYSTDMKDMDTFAGMWLRLDCSRSNGDCSGSDFDESGIVNLFDFAIFADWWMYKP
jgi:hypothetical protein